MKTSNKLMQRASVESIARDRFYEFQKQQKNPLINFLYNERLRQILKMIISREKRKSKACIVLDLGCGKGFFSRVLSLQFTTIGIDVIKSFEVQVQGRPKKLSFMCAEMSFLPFRSHSVDIVVCASVLEHLQDLGGAVEKIRDVLKKDGIFIAGYPVETKLFKFIKRYVTPWGFRFIDQSQTYWCNPYTGKRECYWETPLTHKQDYLTIRNVLRRHFKVLRKVKLPFNVLPDSITYYEIAKMRNEI